jgi:PAS domain S-box-containing protein
MENKKKKIIILLFLLIIPAIIGAFYVRHSWNEALTDNSNQALEIANIAGSALNGEMLKELNAVPEDLGTVAYESIKNRLVSIRNMDSKIRFGYLYTEKSDKLYFIADSEPVTSGDYSPPGQEYTEADPQYFVPFIDGKPLITKPVTDRWGRWVSVLVPLKNAETGKITAVFGFDYPIEVWEREAIMKVLQAVAITVLLLLLFIFIFVVIESNQNTKKNEKNFRTIFETVDDVILVCDQKGKIRYCNESAQKKLGYSSKELREMLLSDLNPKTHHKEAELFFNEIISGKRNLQALPLEKKDGSLLMVETKVFLGKWDGQDCAYGIYKELTDEQELLQKFNQVFNNNPALMFIATFPKFILTDVNKAFIDIVEFSREEIVGKDLFKLGFIVEEENEKKLSEIIGENGSIHDKEVKLLSKSRNLLEGLCDGEIIENQGKKYILFVVTDQTSHIKAEKQLKKALVNAERLNKLMIGRELEMVDLKKEIVRLKNSGGKAVV